MKKQSRTIRILREIAEIIFAFAVAWLGYQALGLAAGTSMPVVAVVSDSMYHTADYESWWASSKDFYESNGIAKSIFDRFSFRNGLSRGDLLFVMNEKPKIGDIVIYEREGAYTIVHRVVAENEHYITKGDNNHLADQPVSKSQIKGRVIFAVPILGYPRLLLFAFGI